MNLVLTIGACLLSFLLWRERPVSLVGDSIIARMGGENNFGISGATTDVIAKAKVPLASRAVFYEGGINDFGNNDIGRIVANYRAMLAAKPYFAKPYLIGILPVDESKLDASWAAVVSNAKIADMNAQITASCPQCIHVSVSLSPDCYLPDGIHLNDNGYVALKQAIAAAQ